MSLKEEELVMLFETFEAIIDEKLCIEHGRDSLNEQMRASKMQQDCINLIAFGEPPKD